MSGEATTGAATRYVMRKDVRSIAEDYWVEDGAGHRAFKVDGKVLSVRHAFALEDLGGTVVASIEERFLSVRDTMEIDIGDRRITVRQEIPGKRDRYHVTVPGGPTLHVRGAVAEHEYTVTAGDVTVGTVTTAWVEHAHTFGIEVGADQDPVLLLAVAVAMDSMAY